MRQWSQFPGWGSLESKPRRRDPIETKWIGDCARPNLDELITATEEIYVCSLPWVREQGSGQTIQEGKEPEFALEIEERLPNALEACGDRMDQHQRQIAHQDQTPLDFLMANADSAARKSAGSLEELLSAVTELQVLVSARKR